MLHRIGQRGRNLERILSDLLHVERMDLRTLQPVWASSDVTALLQRVVAGFDEAAHPITLEAGEVHAKIDAAELERIAENLIDDALTYTPAGTQVWVRAERAERSGVLLIVEDAGPGIPDDQKEALFDPFAGGAPDVTAHGLGLTIAARYAALHGGRAWVEDRAGGGSSFHVLLPGPSATQSGPARHDEGPPQGPL